MARTTEGKVKAVIEVDDDLWSDDFITNASIMVDNLAASGSASSLSSATLEVIETYISAHLYALVDPKPLQEKASRSTTKFQGKTDMGLNATFWGQMALSFDYTGTLAGMTNTDGLSKELTIAWLGVVE